MIRLAALALLAAAPGAPGEAAACRLGLALGLDISSSVDAAEYEIQRGGLVAALRDAEVRAALLDQDGEVRIAVYEWSGWPQQDLLADWTAIDSPGAIDALAARIEAHRRPYAEFSTAIGRAVEYGAALFARLSPPCERRVIDISGDGENNEGRGPDAARRAGRLEGVVVNGLVIRGADLDPVAYYRDHVISGPGAFLVVARDGFADFPAAIRRKLLRELRPEIVAEAWAVRAAALCAALALLAAPARAECALELILAVDVSGSVDADEYRLQTGGTAAAFRDPALIETVEGLDGHVIVAATQWSGASRQSLSVPWARLAGRADMLAFADAVEAAPRAFRHFSTAIGEALRHAATVSGAAPERCRRRVVDVSGDGVNNEGPAPTRMRDAMAAAGYVVNGLVIAGATPDPAPYYLRNVIAGPGAFIEIADGFEDYPRAILKKLLREMEAPAIVAAR